MLQEYLKAHPIYSACTAHPLAIEAVLDYAELKGVPALIEATANQVNQYGGYTGMRPADFVAYVDKLKGERNCQVILGGDHLGPLVWQNLSEQEAMSRSEVLISEYVGAGFTKIHIDTSMRLLGDPEILSDEICARRAARLCKAAERAANPNSPPVYVVGSEVPIPGGAQEDEEGIAVTSPLAFEKTVKTFAEVFEAEGLGAAWQRVIAVVVQPGVEFGDTQVFEYDSAAARSLVERLRSYPNLVFEGHSTDYQTKQKLAEMARDGIKILKVGPALTFAVREALFSLDAMERWLVPESGRANFADVLESAMLEDSSNWIKHYHGNGQEQAFKRRFSYSDRARYYLTCPEVLAASDKLMSNINENPPPLSFLSQYMPRQYVEVREGRLSLSAEELIKSRVRECIETYPL